MEIPKIIHESWHKHLQPLFNDHRMSALRYTILPQAAFYPDSKDIFRVFSMSLENIRAVIIGQDPYPNGEANGLAFAVNENVRIPPSLRIIQQEILSTSTFDAPLGGVSGRWKTLEHWHEQGVFLLNTALTVKRTKAGSHIKYWEWFTKEIIKIISREITPIWMLWGSKAQSLVKTIRDNETFQFNEILLASHPAAQLYSTDNEKFIGCNHFVLCNEILKSKNQQTINW